MSKITKFILTILLISLFQVQTASSTDYSYTNVNSINPTYDTASTFQFVIANKTAANISGAWDVEMGSSGFISQDRRLLDGTLLIDIMSDPTTITGQDSRMIGIDSVGNIFYWDDHLINYSLWFFNEPIGGCTLFGNCNELFRIAGIATNGYDQKMAIDSEGNIYVPTGLCCGSNLQIYKYKKSENYASQLLVTMAAGTDWRASEGNSANSHILDLQVDSSDRLHALVGTGHTDAGATRDYISHSVYNSDTGALLNAHLGIVENTGAGAGALFGNGSILVDEDSPITNYTYGYSYRTATASAYGFNITHNGSNGARIIQSTTAATTLTDMSYSDGVIYAALNSANVIRTFSTNFTAYVRSPTDQVITEGSGVVTYVDRNIDVPNDNYYNDSIIPINIALRFIISDTNHTNYQNSIFWHVRINDPNDVEVFDLNLPGIACVQQSPWWDILGIFTTSDWACDGSGSIEYQRSSGQFWTNGTYTVFLTENVPAAQYIIDYDTYNIVNNSSGNPGTIIVPPGGGGIPGGNPLEAQTDEFLSSGMFLALIFLILFATAGHVIGGMGGAVIGFGTGFIFDAIFNLVPTWSIFLFAILVITAFAVMFGKNTVRSGGGD